MDWESEWENQWENHSKKQNHLWDEIVDGHFRILKGPTDIEMRREKNYTLKLIGGFIHPLEQQQNFYIPIELYGVIAYFLGTVRYPDFVNYFWWDPKHKRK